jgi:two-component system response regulator DegU
MTSDVLLVDDHKIMRDGIKAILSRGQEFRVIGEAENGPDAVQAVKRLNPHLVLMDIGLPGLNGVETTIEILRHDPECKVVILSMYDDENSVVSAIRSGARAFILKKASDNDLLEALRMVARGGAYLSPQVSDRLLARIQKGDLNARQAPAALEILSPRELQVLRMVAEGKTSKEIAVVLDLREQTIRSYRKTMMKKLGVNNVAGLTQLAVSTGLTTAATSGVASGVAQGAHTQSAGEAE